MTLDITEAQPYWPVLPPLADWQETFTTLHMWSQIVGKIRLALAAPLNHCWGSALYVTTCGLTTSPMPYGTGTLAINFDFIAHALNFTHSDGRTRSFVLEAMPVAEFYRRTMQTLAGLGLPVHLFWGSFDLATTRFSGRTAPKPSGGTPNCPNRVMVEAYSHELWSPVKTREQPQTRLCCECGRRENDGQG